MKLFQKLIKVLKNLQLMQTKSVLNGKEINLTSDNTVIKSTNFSADKNGNMKCNNADVTGKITATSGKIAGFTIDNNTLKGSQVGMCGLDGEEWAFWSGSSQGSNAPFKAGHNGKVYMSDAEITGGILKLTSDGTQSVFTIENSNNSNKKTTVFDDGICVYNSNTTSTPVISLSTTSDGGSGLSLLNSDKTGSASFNVNSDGSSDIYVDLAFIDTLKYYTLTQRSEEKLKKNINKYEKDCLSLIKNSNIYEFNFKTDKNTNKKRIGFIIGKDYKTPEEIISQNKDGIDIYSMCSVIWKAIQEQQEQIEKLQKEIQELKEAK